MASLLLLKQRIKGAQNVSKTTRAMQMVAASKMKKAQEATLSTRPYVEKLSEINHNLLEKLDNENNHPYLLNKSVTGKSLIIVLSPDKGLCGGLITNLLREFVKNQKTDLGADYIIVGKKAITKVAHLTKDIIASFNFSTSTPTFDMVMPLTKLIDEHYLSGNVDSVKILYTNFDSIFTQVPKIATLLPLTVTDNETDEKDKESTDSEYIFEPSISDILPDILKHYLEMSLFQFLLESFVSEQGARMISMQNATSNANDIISDLQLEYNKTRQAKITSEILDLNSGGMISA